MARIRRTVQDRFSGVDRGMPSIQSNLSRTMRTRSALRHFLDSEAAGGIDEKLECLFAFCHGYFRGVVRKERG